MKKDNPKILGYGNFSKLEKLMSKHFPSQLKAVCDKLTETPKTMIDLNKYVKDGNFTHIIIPDEHFHQLDENLSGCNVPIIELLGDHFIPWAIERKKNYMKENEIKHAFISTDRFLEKYDKITNFHLVNYGYDNQIFANKNKNKDIDILISGSLGKKKNHTREVYPVRNWLAKVIPEIGIKEGIKVETLGHPGYNTGKETNHQKEYCDIINRSKIATGGSSHWRLPFKKFYEITACGTILLSDLPLDDTEFFREKIIEINPEKITDREYKDVIKREVMNILENYEKVKGNFQPFATEKDRFSRSYKGRALEMREIISNIE